MEVVFAIPVYNERETLESLAEGISRYAGDIDHRILFVDDGSTDGSYELLCTLRARYSTVDVIKLRRNFGKSQALAAAIHRARGDVLVTMDGDLQDDPEEIPKLLGKLAEGYDVVCGWKAARRDPWHKTFPSRIYNALVSWIFGLPLHDVNTGFKAMRMEVAKRLPLYGELHRMIAVFAGQLGYRVTEAPVKHHPRSHGQSKYGFERFSRGALDIITAWFLLRRGQSPNHLFGFAGCCASAAGALALLAGVVYGAVQLWIVPAPAEVRRLTVIALLLWLIVCVTVLMWGSLIFTAGLLGELILHRLPPVDPADYIEEELLG